MTTSFSIDLDKNSLQFGTVANGQVTNVKGNVSISSKQGTQPFGGKIEGDFVGEVKNANTIPITIPHKKDNPAGFNIIVVGAGGTGGYLIRDLTRFIYALREKGDSRQFAISLVDGDDVEQKNVLRQNFTSRDVGKKKADVQAKRYASTFGIEIQSIAEMADANLLSSLYDRKRIGNNNVQNIVIGCVDNHRARREIAKFVRNNNDIYWIDSGNEKKSGQVVIGYGRFGGSAFGGYRPPPRNTHYAMPNVIDLYPEIADANQDEVQEVKVSCAERAIVDTQSIQVNITAANHILNCVTQIVMGEPITINAIEFNTKGVTNVKHLTEGYLRDAYEKTRNQNIRF